MLAAVLEVTLAAGTGSAPYANLPSLRDFAASSAASANDDIVQRYCVRCHNGRRLIGNLTLEEFDAADPVANAPVAEKMIRKLRAGMMPPPGVFRGPPGTTRSRPS